MKVSPRLKIQLDARVVAMILQDFNLDESELCVSRRKTKQTRCLILVQGAM